MLIPSIFFFIENRVSTFREKRIFHRPRFERHSATPWGTWTNLLRGGGIAGVGSGPSPPPLADVGERGKAIFPTGSPPSSLAGAGIASDPGSLLYTVQYPRKCCQRFLSVPPLYETTAKQYIFGPHILCTWNSHSSASWMEHHPTCTMLLYSICKKNTTLFPLFWTSQKTLDHMCWAGIYKEGRTLKVEPLR
jgi:hypothetical protein